jgi:membrane protein YqaA with SNARE-associated domain
LLHKLTTALLAIGPFGIFLVGVIDALGLPLPAAMDFLMVTIAVKEPQKAYFAALMAVLGSTGGNVALFLAARHGSRWFIKGDPASWRGQKFQRWFQRYGLVTVFVPTVTPVVPFPLKVFVMSAGALRTSFAKFLAVIVVARVIRYFGEAYLGLHLGEHAEAYLRRNAWPLLGAALVLATGLYLLIRLNERRGESVL